MSYYQEKSLRCCDCGATFKFTAREQEFYAAKGFTQEPKRCYFCRQQKKLQRGESTTRSYTRSY